MIIRTSGLIGVLLAGLVNLGAAQTIPSFECVGVVNIPADQRVDDVLVGGLSGISYDAENDLFFAVSDDRSRLDPARFFTLRITLDDGRLDAGDVVFTGASILKDLDGKPFAMGTVDPEGIAIDQKGSILISSEGVPHKSLDPFIRRFARDGSFVTEVDLPRHFRVGIDPLRGVRSNFGFEALGFAPGHSALFAVAENALHQDGPRATVEHTSRSRIVEFSTPGLKAVREYVYEVEKVAEAPASEDGEFNNGVTDILVLDRRAMVAIERGFSEGKGFTIRLFLLRLDRATDVLGFASLQKVPREDLRMVDKTLILDVADLGFEPDNIEGITFGPRLPDGRRSVVLVSDNNFNPGAQVTQFIVLAMDDFVVPPRPAVSIAEVQGAGHWSPLQGQWVDGLSGVVTACHDDRQGRRHCWMQDPVGDGNSATSDAIYLRDLDLPGIGPGDELVVSGRVQEFAWKDELPVTQVEVDQAVVEASGQPIPDPVVLGTGGRTIPSSWVDNDGLKLFEPADDAVDFFESLEGMTVQVDDPVVIGPTTHYGGMVVLADGGSQSSLRTMRGGLIGVPGDVNPERLIIGDLLRSDPPRYAVGQHVGSSIRGILHYAFGNYQIMNTSPIPKPRDPRPVPEITRLRGDEQHVTLATFNVENLSFLESEKRFSGIARVIAEHLAAPDILVVEEIQDDSGPSDDGTVSAQRTLGRLVEAIEKVGGPRYTWRQCNPGDGQDGGRPGANIRTVLLYNPQRVDFVDRGDCCAPTIEDGPGIQCSPGRIGVSDPAFDGFSPESAGTRKPLVGEFLFRGERIFVVGVHLSSKFGDDRFFGIHQPPRLQTNEVRIRQSEVIGDWVVSVRSRDKEAAIAILGDFNDDPGSATLTTVTKLGLTNLMTRVAPADRYTHVFEGNAHAIDHIVVNSDLADKAEIDIVHVNADYPSRERASDHDAVLARFRFVD